MRNDREEHGLLIRVQIDSSERPFSSRNTVNGMLFQIFLTGKIRVTHETFDSITKIIFSVKQISFKLKIHNLIVALKEPSN